MFYIFSAFAVIFFRFRIFQHSTSADVMSFICIFATVLMEIYSKLFPNCKTLQAINITVCAFPCLFHLALYLSNTLSDVTMLCSAVMWALLTLHALLPGEACKVTEKEV